MKKTEGRTISHEKQCEIRSLPAVVLLVVFVGLSFRFINAPLKTRRSEFHSTELKQAVTKDGDVIRTDFIDDNGELRVAADYGYATKLVLRQGNSETETYLNDLGSRISRYAGYYGILREYDAKGNNIRITYLDKNNNPMIMSLMYAVEEREFNESGQPVLCRYFDAKGNPALSSDNGFAVRYEYDNKGRKVRITHLDEKGEPAVLPSGYCILTREYYETDSPNYGRVRREFYYLPDGTPASLSLGQSGIYKEYDENGMISLTTYLDADGSPMVTNKGYTSIALTYYADNTVQSTLYYDLNGNPLRMSEGQYGIKNVSGQTVYLNADGTEQFNIKNFVHNDSRFVIIIAIALVALSAFAAKKLNWLMLILYIGESRIILLRSFRWLLFNAGLRADILKNIWLFIPFGAILLRLFPRKAVLLVPILLSVTIEAVQYFTGMGFCELDDVISNGLGGAVGYGTARLIQTVRGQFHSNRDYHILNQGG